MTSPPDPLRAALQELADAAAPADLYPAALHRSRRIARREATIGTAAALAALALLASGLWRIPDRNAEGPQAATRSSATSQAWSSLPTARPAVPDAPTVSQRVDRSPGPAAQRHNRQPLAATAVASPRSRSLADLPGHVFYEQPGARPDVVRMSPDDGTTETVLSNAPSPVGVSPDGSRIAYVEDGNLLITRTGGGQADRVATGVATTDQAPTWSPDGDRLLVDASTPAILQVDTGTLTPLPDRLEQGQHFRWSGDGSKLVYATAFCGLQVTSSSGDGDAAVPVLGDLQLPDNPDELAACKPTSVDVTGQRVTVPLQTTGETGEDGPDAADTVVDTVTGAVVPPPVTGVVVGTVFGPDGRLLVRSVRDGKPSLSLFAANGTLLVESAEPAELHGFDLLAYTR